MAWPPATIAADKADGTATPTDHAAHHNSLATGVNDIVSVLGSVLALDANRIEFPSRLFATGSSTLTAGAVFYTYFVAPYNLTVANLVSRSGGTAGVAPTLARMGIYTADGSDNLTLVARTASDTALWTAINTLYTKALDTTGGYPATYALVKGSRYAIALLTVGNSTAPTLTSVASSAALAGFTPVLSRQNLSETDLVTSVVIGAQAVIGSVFYVAATP